MGKDMAKPTYQSAGVDLEVYRQAMARLPVHTRRTYSPRVIPLDGGFAGLFQLDFDSPLFARRYEQPVLVSCTDGVGTKLKVATQAGVYDTVGIDLVAMCVNDAVCCGAEPLFFLDYVAMDRDDPERLEQLVRGMCTGCVEGDCALLGGETAIMPDVYAPGEFDLAGFCVGVVERKDLIDGHAIAPGDAVIGLASSGLHSNGYSLVRKVAFERAKLPADQHVPKLAQTVAEALLTPTRIYTRAVRAILNHYRVKRVVHGIAHITGGGLQENIERILPEDIRVTVDQARWKVPAVFPWLQELGGIETEEMYRVFNMGIGMALLVSPYYADSICQQLAQLGYPAGIIGHAEAGPRGVILQGT